eukprot:COSAG02_NODE_321_length_24780_cov_11.623962_13_plen_41_part_00
MTLQSTLTRVPHRWLNHLNPSVKKGPWAIEEEETLIHGHR